MKDFPSYGVKNKNHRIVRQKPISSNRKFVQICLMWGIIIAVALFFVQQRIEYIETQRRVNRLLLEKQRLSSELLPLKIEEEYLTRLDMVEGIARDHFQLEYPVRRQVIKLPLHPASTEKSQE